MTPTYQDAHPTYRRRGWPVLPLRARTKWPPPSGFTGWDGVDPSFADCLEFNELPQYRGTRQTCVRMPPSVLGIDVDAYKTGGATITEAGRRWCALPDGPWSSARSDGVSGIRFYRVPDGTVLVGDLAFPELRIGHIEIVQRHHRYAVVWPSVHPQLGSPYTWRGTAGPDVPPDVADLPELPATWLAALGATGRQGERAQPEQVAEFLAALPAGSACPTVMTALRAADASLRAPVVSRHDDVCAAVLRLLRLGEQGHPGTTQALAALKVRFIRVVTADGSRTYASAVAEYDRMVSGNNGIGLIRATPTDPARHGCRCGTAPEPPTRAALIGILRTVLSASSEERPRLLAWATRKLRTYATGGQLDPIYVANLVTQLQQVGCDAR